MNRYLSHRIRASVPVLLVASVLVALWTVPLESAPSDKPNLYEQIEAFNGLQQLVERHYYNDTDPTDLFDGAIEGYLSKLDPHSTYISPQELRGTQERLQGTFEGIGIYFSINNGYLRVMSPIEGSPAYDVGLLAGDRIVRIDGKSSIGIKEAEVFDRLKGPKGSTVSVSVQRKGEDELLEFEMVRDRIHVPSVPYYFLLEPESPDVGYVKLNRFSQRTSAELAEAIRDLNAQGAQKFVLDLRGNGGGYLEQAVDVANQFIEKGRLVVYTMGRHVSSREDHVAARDPLVSPDTPLIILVDSYSASASEIVAGAVQDYDRGLIVGHTSFGKGLVQKQYPLQNGGAVLLTVARYFTPSDRPIQRPFSEDLESYLMKGHDDYDPNTDPDSLTSKPVFHTVILRRKVYGSGGISPDVTLPPDSAAAIPAGIRRSHFFEFATENAQTIAGSYETLDEFRAGFQAGQREVDDFREYLQRKEINVDHEEIQASAEWVGDELTRYIAQIRWGIKARGRIDVGLDPQVSRAVDLFDKASELLATRDYHYNRRRLTNLPAGNAAEQVR